MIKTIYVEADIHKKIRLRSIENEVSMQEVITQMFLKEEQREQNSVEKKAKTMKTLIVDDEMYERIKESASKNEMTIKGMIEKMITKEERGEQNEAL